MEAVCDLADSRLRDGDPRGALAAVALGLKVIPLHERLTELAVEAWLSAGDRRAARAVYQEYRRGVEGRGEEVMPEVARLAARLA